MVRVHLCPPVINHYRGLAQMARALALGARGREFESRIPDFVNAVAIDFEICNTISVEYIKLENELCMS